VHYHFTSKEEMEKEIAAGMFIEHAVVHANMYGTSVRAVQSVLERGRICLLDIDIQGCQTIKKTATIAPLFIYIRPPSIAVLQKRLLARGEAQESVAKRMETAKWEMEFVENNPDFFDCQILNDSLPDAYDQLLRFLLSNDIIW